MTIIELPDEQAEALKAKAAAQGLTLEDWFKKLALSDNDPASAPAAPRRHISERIREIMSDVPREVFETLPKDGASEHDHYIYGTPKRNQ
jgi:hypothetical protein